MTLQSDESYFSTLEGCPFVKSGRIYSFFKSSNANPLIRLELSNAFTRKSRRSNGGCGKAKRIIIGTYRFNEPVVRVLASRTIDSHELICFLERSLNEYKDHFDCNQTTSLVSQYRPRIFKIFLRNSPEALEYTESVELLSLPHRFREKENNS